MRKRSTSLMTFDGGTSVARRVACLGLAPTHAINNMLVSDLTQTSYLRFHRRTLKTQMLAATLRVGVGILTIPAFVCGDKTKVFALCLSTFTYAPTDTSFQLVRRTYSFVAFFQLYGHCSLFISMCATNRCENDTLPTESPIPYRHHDVPTQDFTVRSALPG